MKFVFEILEIMCTLKWTTALIHCPVVMRFFFGKNSVIEIYIDFHLPSLWLGKNYSPRDPVPL